MEKTVMKRLVSVVVILTLIFSLAFAFLNSQSVAHADSSNGQKNIVSRLSTISYKIPDFKPFSSNLLYFFRPVSVLS